MMRILTLGMLVVAFGLSGCMGFGGDVSRMYDDANRQFGDKFNGGVSETKTVTIPGGTGNLRVALAVETAGGVNIALKNPAGLTVQELNQGGTADKKDDSWFTTSNPMQGNWKLELSLGGSGSYAAGFYYS